MVVVKKEWMDEAASLSSSDMEALRLEAERVRALYRPDRRPSGGAMCSVGLWWALLGLAAVGMALWFVLPYDAPYIATKEGRDTTMSWVVGGGAVALGLGMVAAGSVAMRAAQPSGTGKQAHAAFVAFALTAVLMLVVNAGIYYVYYSDSELTSGTVRGESSVVPLIGIGVLIFFMVPCVVFTRSYAHDLAHYEHEHEHTHDAGTSSTD